VKRTGRDTISERSDDCPWQLKLREMYTSFFVEIISPIFAKKIKLKGRPIQR